MCFSFWFYFGSVWLLVWLLVVFYLGLIWVLFWFYFGSRFGFYLGSIWVPVWFYVWVIFGFVFGLDVGFHVASILGLYSFFFFFGVGVWYLGSIWIPAFLFSLVFIWGPMCVLFVFELGFSFWDYLGLYLGFDMGSICVLFGLGFLCSILGFVWG